MQGWEPPPRPRGLTVAVPLSYGETEHSLLLRTLKWGILGRLLGVYRASRVILYPVRGEPVPGPHRRLARLVLRYLVTAPYLRRLVYPRTSLLRYAGALPPLQLPTHGVGGPKLGECRQALVLANRGGVLELEAGLGRRVAVRGRGKPGDIVLVEVSGLEPLRVGLGCSRPVYNGYQVLVRESLRGVLEGGFGDVVIATSRLGEAFSHERAAGLLSRARRGVVTVFGSPWRGLHEIARAEGFALEDAVDAVWNTVPRQGTLTVRVEEAVAATLALVNLYLE